MPLQFSGVFVKQKDIHQSQKLLTGYLGLSTTGDLRKWISDPAFTSIVGPFLVEDKACFGLTGPKCKREKAVAVKTVMAAYKDPAIVSVVALSSMDKIPAGKERPLQCYLFTIYRVIERFPNIFKDSVGLTYPVPEDIHRCVYLLKYTIKGQTDSRKGKGVHRDEPATTPDYYNSKNGTPPPDLSTAGESTKPKDDCQIPIGPIVPSDTDDHDENRDGADDLDPLDQVEAALGLPKKDIDLPPISRNEMIRLIRKLAEGAPDITIEDTAISPDPSIVNNMLSSATAMASTGEDATDFSRAPKPSIWELNRKLNVAGAIASTYIEACSFLGVDPENPVYMDVLLKVWQVPGIVWMMQQEDSPLRGGILGDQCGLGKTIMALILIAATAKTAKAPFKPTLVLVPSNLVASWVYEIHNRFQGVFRLLLYYGTTGAGGTTDFVLKQYLVKPKELEATVRALDPNDPSTASTIILTSYSTWHYRTLKRPIPLARGQEEQRTRIESHGESHGTDINTEDMNGDDEEPDEIESGDDPDGDMETELPQITYASKWPSDLSFNRIVMDEGHFVKNPRTKVHQSVAALQTNHLWIMTATSMMNKPLDLKGYLSLLYRDEFDATAPDYRKVTDVLDVYKQSALDNDADLHLLNPSLFSRLFHHGHISPEGALVALPRILNKIQLRRAMGTEMEMDGDKPNIVIGSDIPPYGIKTVEVKMTPLQMAQYARIHSRLCGLLKLPSSKGPTNDQEREVGGKFNMSIYRRLRHASFSLSLEHLATATSATSEGNLAQDIATWRAKDSSGLKWFLSRIFQDVSIPSIPMDREWIATYLKKSTPKYGALAAIVDDTIIKRKRRLLIFQAYPMPQYETDMFLSILGLKVLSIRASMSMQERAAVAARFNDPNEDVDALVVTYRTCSLGLNLHLACADVVMMEPAINANTTLQALGRVHRLGQLVAQRIWILFGQNTFDRFVEHNQVVKFIPQILGMGYSNFGSLDCGREDGEDKDNDLSEWETVLQNQADELIQQMLGQESSRLKYGDLADLGFTDNEILTINRLLKQLGDGQMTLRSKKVLEVSPTKAGAQVAVQLSDESDEDSETSEATSEDSVAESELEEQQSPKDSGAPNVTNKRRAAEPEVDQTEKRPTKIVCIKTRKILDPRPPKVFAALAAQFGGKNLRPRK